MTSFRAFFLLILLCLLTLLGLNTTKDVTPHLAVGHYFSASFPYSISIYNQGSNPTYYKISPLDDYLITGPNGQNEHFLSWKDTNQNEELARQSFPPYKTWGLVTSYLFNRLPLIFEKKSDVNILYTTTLTTPTTLTVNKKIAGFGTIALGFVSVFGFGASDIVTIDATQVTIINKEHPGRIVIPVNPFDHVTVDEVYKVIKIETGFNSPQTDIDLNQIIYVY